MQLLSWVRNHLKRSPRYLHKSSRNCKPLHRIMRMLDWSPTLPHSGSRLSTVGPRSSTPVLPKCKEKQDLANVMKRAFEERQAGCEETALKRVKADKDVGMENIASQERFLSWRCQWDSTGLNRLSKGLQTHLNQSCNKSILRLCKALK